MLSALKNKDRSQGVRIKWGGEGMGVLNGEVRKGFIQKAAFRQQCGRREHAGW